MTASPPVMGTVAMSPPLNSPAWTEVRENVTAALSGVNVGYIGSVMTPSGGGPPSDVPPEGTAVAIVEQVA